jgi:hypothetical protein
VAYVYAGRNSCNQSFCAGIPDEALDHEWELFKRWELTETEIPSKYKELLMIAVHPETRCRYYLLFRRSSTRSGSTCR